MKYALATLAVLLVALVLTTGLSDASFTGHTANPTNVLTSGGTP
jgi:hypothetical protein